MPRNFKNIPFNGGLNNAKDPRDLTNEVSDVSNVQFVKDGVLQSDGSLVAPTGVSTVFASMTGIKNYGLFTFGADWDMPSYGSITGVANTGGIGGVGDARYTTSDNHGLATGDRVFHYGFTTTAYNGYKTIEVVTATTYDTTDTYVDNITGSYVEVSEATNTSNEKYIALADGDTSAAIDIMPVTDDVVHRGMISLGGSAAGSRAVFYYIDGALRVCDVIFRTGNVRKWFGYIKGNHFTCGDAKEDVLDGWYSKDAAITAPTHGIVGGGVLANGDGDSTATILKSDGNYEDYDIDGTEKYVAIHIVAEKARAITAQGAGPDYEITTDDLGGADTWIGTGVLCPPEGAGFTLGLTSGAGVGTWTADELEFAQTFIYDGVQESLPNIMKGTFTPTASKEIYGQIYATKSYNERLTGARIYYRESGPRGDWKLFLDISFEKGVRVDPTEEFMSDEHPWTYRGALTGSGDAPTDAYFYAGLAIYWYDPPTTLTYENLTGISQSTISLEAKFRCAATLNRRTWIANVKVANEAGDDVIHGDRIMYSPVNCFDSFPNTFYLDVGINDGDEFTALQGFNDRLLAFKSETLYIINVAQGEDTGWFLESTNPYMGVETPSATYKTDIGIVWVNKNGCYYYDGNKIYNLIEDAQGNKILDGSTWDSDIHADVLIGYEPLEKQVIVVCDANATAGKTYIYDFSTKTWTYNTSFSQSSGDNMTNFAPLENELIVGRYDSGNQTTIKKWDPTPVAGTGWVTFKDEDFGNPHQVKRIYGFSITYKASVKINMNDLVTYALDGGTSFVNTYIPATELPVAATWNMAYIELSTPISVQSIRVKAAWTSNLVRVNDIAVENRPIHKEFT